MRLRIFEPRYLRLVKEALADDVGFILCMLNPQGNIERNEHIYSVGTHVNVVDFESLPDGMLGITIEGTSLVKINTISTESDQLRRGVVEFLKPWPNNVAEEAKPSLVARLQEVFKMYPELNALYPEKRYDDIAWLCGRWLELLPLEPGQKQSLIASQCPKQISSYICELFD